MNTNDCLTDNEIIDGERVIAIAMVEAQKEYGISIVSGAGTFAPPISAISLPITGIYEDYTIKADDNFASQHFLKLTGCSKWEETKKFIDAEPTLFFPKEHLDDIRFAKINKSLKEVEKKFHPMGWAFFKEDTWNFIQDNFKTDQFESAKKFLLEKLNKIDFNSKNNFNDIYDLSKDLSFKSYEFDDYVMKAKYSNYSYTHNYFMQEKFLDDFESIKNYIENDFYHEYHGLKQIINVYNLFRNYDKVIHVSSRLGSSSYLPPNDLIALTLKQKMEAIMEKINEGYLEKDDKEFEQFQKDNDTIIDIIRDFKEVSHRSKNHM